MALDIGDLAAFYTTPLGTHVTERLADEIGRIWPQPAGGDDLVLGYGYAAPLAGPPTHLWAKADWHLLMPAQQGVMSDTPTSSILADERYWPVRDNSVNRLLALHGLEASTQVERLLDEAWRVLRPNGRALFIVANRRGLWARRDKTPFGAGRPFSSSQMRQILRRTGFVPGLMRPTLMLPPNVPLPLVRRLAWLERGLSLTVPQLGGVWLVEAVKQVPAPQSVEKARSARARNLVGVPRPALSPKL
jgi:SAM-dependent methyltransferase